MDPSPTANAAAPLSLAVVLCTYNGASYLQRQLDSLYAQSRLPDCVVLSDDASTDDTTEILARAATRFETMGVRVHFLRHPTNVGYVRNFERGFKLAHADLIFPCDQDDVWYPSKLARMTAVFEADNTLDVLHSDAELIDANGAPMGRRLFEVLELSATELRTMTEGDAFDVLIRRNIVTGAAMAFRTRVLDQALPFPDAWAHDEWLAIVASVNGKVRSLNEALLGYRQHGNNQIGVQARGLRHKATGIAGYRRAFLARMEARYEVFNAHVKRMQRVPPERFARVEDRLRHAQSRNRQGTSIFARIREVTRELLSGRYHRFGKGIRSALVDLFGLN